VSVPLILNAVIPAGGGIDRQPDFDLSDKSCAVNLNENAPGREHLMWKGPRISAAPHRAPVKWTHAMLKELGAMSDQVFSTKHKIGRSSVHRKRLEMGIAAYSEESF